MSEKIEVSVDKAFELMGQSNDLENEARLMLNMCRRHVIYASMSDPANDLMFDLELDTDDRGGMTCNWLLEYTPVGIVDGIAIRYSITEQSLFAVPSQLMPSETKRFTAQGIYADEAKEYGVEVVRLWRGYQP